jgi:hypothetical protein
MARIVTIFLEVTVYSDLVLRLEGLLRVLQLEEVLVSLGMLLGTTDQKKPSALGKDLSEP